MYTAHKQKGCFPAGTRIITEQGLVPIQDIKVGDMVLSKPESGEGELCYKPVIRTASYEDTEIWELTYFQIKADTDISKLNKSKLLQLSKKGQMSTILATPNHPFWVNGLGWTQLDELQSGQILQTRDIDIVILVFSVQPRYKTDKPFIAASYSPRNIFDADKKGFDIDNVDYYFFLEQHPDGHRKYIGNGDNPSPLILKEHDPIYVLNEAFSTTAFHLEIADYHTYFIFNDGLWVHSTDYPQAF
ncbi:hypothetical protein A7P54_11645 [Acinetobacter sp. Ac_3412]|uniref:Hint domain-containing protein n=1 Tax=Acinetobacter sp. Ac_3412 TaxID=1848935 RepID=UPI00148F6F86|nr:Hint domain-containing protein [Acinetobacter sp. Ac_3412]NNP77070.1 hypothetical protein [Acinetobacter sp. Ac_3412]